MLLCSRNQWKNNGEFDDQELCRFYLHSPQSREQLCKYTRFSILCGAYNHKIGLLFTQQIHCVTWMALFPYEILMTSTITPIWSFIFATEFFRISHLFIWFFFVVHRSAVLVPIRFVDETTEIQRFMFVYSRLLAVLF